MKRGAQKHLKFILISKSFIEFDTIDSHNLQHQERSWDAHSQRQKCASCNTIIRCLADLEHSFGETVRTGMEFHFKKLDLHLSRCTE